jgi:hypothetical protein
MIKTKVELIECKNRQPSLERQLKKQKKGSKSLRKNKQKNQWLVKTQAVLSLNPAAVLNPQMNKRLTKKC